MTNRYLYRYVHVHVPNRIGHKEVGLSTAEFSTRIIQLFELIAYFPVPRINF